MEVGIKEFLVCMTRFNNKERELAPMRFHNDSPSSLSIGKPDQQVFRLLPEEFLLS